MTELKIATLTQKHGTVLSTEDVKNICDDVRNGISYAEVRKKYSIGGGRLARILKICNVKSIIKGKWENMDPNEIILNDNVVTGSKYRKDYDTIPNKEPNNLDTILTKQVDAMKKNMESIKFKSFID